MLSWFFGGSEEIVFMGAYSDAEVGFMCCGGVVFAVAVFAFSAWVKLKQQDEEEAERELRRKKAEQEALEKYEAARLGYESALDNLEREDTKQNRIAALAKGREYCATSREYAHGNKSVTAVDEQMITNDINARTCD